MQLHAADAAHGIFCCCLLLVAGCDEPATPTQPQCSGCLIGGICYPPAVTNPANGCQICDTAISRDSWQDHDGALCDDGIFCNGPDRCANGACTAGADPICGDDGMFCNGGESCNEGARACEHTGNPCGGGLWCNETIDSCVATCGGCLIQGICVFDGQPSPANLCLRCDVATSSTAWTDNDGATCNDDGRYCTGLETCDGDACVSSGSPCLATEVCWEDSGGQCCSAGGIFQCNAAQDVEEYDSCGHLLRVAVPCGSLGGTCDNGRCHCNPVSQIGCRSGEKCAIDELEPECQPAGDKGFGQACTVAGDGSDDCAAGGHCSAGICAEICTETPDSCGDGFFCDYRPFPYSARLGLCVPRCDPVVQDCLAAGDACYLRFSTGDALCAAVPVEAQGLTQGDPCYAQSGGGACYFQGCDEGYAPLLPDDTCTFFCTPIDNWLGNVQGLAGDPAGITCGTTFAGARPDGPGSSYECRYVQSYYSNTGDVPASVGMCVDPLTEGSCADFDWVQLQADFDAGLVDDAMYCTDHPERCRLSCIARATANAGL